MQTGPVRKVMRVITRTNVGGPALHVSLLTAQLGADFDTMLVAGQVAQGEAEATSTLQHYGVMPFRVPALVRPVSPGRDIRAYRFLRETIRKWKPDIVHTHTAKAGALGRIAARREAVPPPRPYVPRTCFSGSPGQRHVVARPACGATPGAADRCHRGGVRSHRERPRRTVRDRPA